jgi:hypothetical protein
MTLLHEKKSGLDAGSMVIVASLAEPDKRPPSHGGAAFSFSLANQSNFAALVCLISGQ